MGIYIKDMEIPKNCGVCCFAGSCGIHNNNEEWPDLESIMFNDVIGVNGVRDPDCPLVPVPPHGRLIDMDALVSKIRYTDNFYETPFVTWADIFKAQTVIPTDKDGET